MGGPWPNGAGEKVSMRTKNKKRPGPPSLFRGKLRQPVSVTLTPQHHRKVAKAMRRLRLTRSDLIALLIDKHADTVTKEYADAYGRLRQMAEALGGTLTHVKRDEPRGGTWVLVLGDNELRIPSIQSKRYPPLDACFRLKYGVTVSQTWEDHTNEIDASGLAQLFTLLASSPRHSDSEGSSVTAPLQMQLTEHGEPPEER